MAELRETSRTQVDRLAQSKIQRTTAGIDSDTQPAQEPVDVSSRRHGMSPEDFELARVGTQSLGKRWRHAKRVNL
jgi:hypothetical protein